MTRGFIKIGRSDVISAACLMALLLILILIPACDRGHHRVTTRTEGVYDVDLRMAIRDAQYPITYEGADKFFIRHWKLEIPWAYVYAYRGHNGSVNGQGYGGDPQKQVSRKIVLNGLIDWDAGKIIPSPHRATQYDVTIVLWQGRVGPDLWSDKRCLTFDMYRKLVGRPDGIGRDVCEMSDSRLCTTKMQMDGWGVDVSLERRFYESDPQPVCDIVRNFLNELTIERESVMLDTLEGEDG